MVERDSLPRTNGFPFGGLAGPQRDEAAEDSRPYRDGGTGIALITSGTSLGMVRLNLPIWLQPARLRFDSTDLVSAFDLPAHECAAPLAMGSLAAVVSGLREGRLSEPFASCLWIDQTETGRPRVLYTPPRLGANGGDGVPNQVGLAAMLRSAELRGELDRVLARARRAARAGAHAAPLPLTILATTTARTTGRGSILKLAELMQKPRPLPESSFVLHLSLAGLPEQDAAVAARAQAGTTALLLELSAIERVLREGHRICRIVGSGWGRGAVKESDHPDSGSPLYEFVEGVADFVTLMEPGTKGLDDELAVQAWHAGLFSLLAVLGPNTAALQLRQSMERWKEATSLQSEAGYPAMFSAIGYAVVVFDAAQEARRLAECDAAVLLQAALEQVAAVSNVLDRLEGEDVRPDLVSAITQVVDPRGLAEEARQYQLNPSHVADAGALEQEVIAIVDRLRDGLLGEFQEARSAANARALDWLRTALGGTARRRPFSLGELMARLPDELDDLARSIRQAREAALDAARAEVEAAIEAVTEPGIPVDIQRGLLTKLNGDVGHYIGQFILAERDEVVVGALRFAVGELRAADRSSGPGPVLEAIRAELLPSGMLGRPIERLGASTDAGDSPAHRTLLTGRLRLQLYEKLQLGRAGDGRPNLRLLSQLFERAGLDQLLLRSLSPDLSTRLQAQLAGSARNVARKLIATLVDALAEEHHKRLAEQATLGRVLGYLDPEQGRSRLRELYRSAFDYAQPPVQLGDPAVQGTPVPRSFAFVEFDDEYSRDLVDDVVGEGVRVTIGRTEGVPARMVVIRALTGITLDLLTNYRPGGGGWEAYQLHQARWKERLATPVHTIPPLERLVERFLQTTQPPSRAAWEAEAAATRALDGFDQPWDQADDGDQWRQQADEAPDERGA